MLSTILLLDSWFGFGFIARSSLFWATFPFILGCLFLRLSVCSLLLEVIFSLLSGYLMACKNGL